MGVVESSFLNDISRNAMRRYWHEERPLHLRDFMDFIDHHYRTNPGSNAATEVEDFPS